MCITATNEFVFFFISSRKKLKNINFVSFLVKIPILFCYN